MASRLRSSPPSSGAGAVSEKDFQEAFANTQPEKLADQHALVERLQGISAFLINPNNDWAKKVKILSNLRGCLISSVPHSVEIVAENAGIWKKCLTDGLKELRSTLTREYCITIAFFAVKLRNRFMPQVEHMFGNLINLVKNSTKVISSSGIMLLEYIAKYVNNGSLIPVAAGYMSSKAGQIRTYVVKMLRDMLVNWDKDLLTPHLNIIKTIIKTGLTDAAAECRSTSQEAYYAFYNKFSLQALQLYDSLDGTRQKALNHQKSAALSSTSHSYSRQSSGIAASKPKPFVLSRTPSFTPQQASSRFTNNNDQIKSAGFGIPRRVANTVRKPSPIRQTFNRAAEAPAILTKSNAPARNSNPVLRQNGSHHQQSSSMRLLEGSRAPLVRHNPADQVPRPSRISVFGTIRSSSLPRTTSDSAIGSSTLRSRHIENRMLKT